MGKLTLPKLLYRLPEEALARYPLKHLMLVGAAFILNGVLPSQMFSMS